MISGLGSSSVSLALRTAQRAEKTVAKTTEQIATGKKVNSVKDDGAAYARSTALKSQKAGIEARGDLIAILKTASEQQMAGDTVTMELFAQAREKILAAKGFDIGSSNRQALQKEFDAIVAQIDIPTNTDGTLTGSYNFWGAAGWGVEPNAADPILSQNAIWFHYAGGVGAWWNSQSVNGVAFKNNNLVTATNVQLDALLSYADAMVVNYRDSYLQWAASDQKWLEDISNSDSLSLDNIDKAISSLTDADMGKVSKEYEMAQTRQNLAYQTVRNAITQYGNVASGLLNNVMGTQRSVMA